MTTWNIREQGSTYTLSLSDDGIVLHGETDRVLRWDTLTKVDFPGDTTLQVTTTEGPVMTIAFADGPGAREAFHREARPRFRERFGGTKEPAGADVLLSTLDHITDRATAETIGLVTVSVVMSRDMFSDIGADLKSLVGGKLGGLERAMDVATEVAHDRLREKAAALDADAVLGCHLVVASVTEKAQTIMASGTAVKLEPEQE